ncbi:BnaA09g01700D [Brassica napus]|uniref:BnaA09g01700D protein n=2 Tax=Brassica napus TaxID=3708 RepID=A0A078IGR7_BRANA|nr:BnaA09g01700D [Brassica napus]
MKEDGKCINWEELPSEITSSILRRLSSIDILENAQKVCTSWRGVCKDPVMWRKIDMRNPRNLVLNLEMMCRHAVDRSQGGLAEIDIWHFGTDSLLNYIADRSSNLRSLRLAMCSSITDVGLTEALVKLPLLEDLEVSYCSLSAESLKVVGQSCPNLKTLKLNREGFNRFPYESDDDALAIAETMPRLGHLQLFGNKLTEGGLNAILDNCLDLEHLDVRRCLNVYLFGDLKKRCSERVKVLRRPLDSIRGYPYEEAVNHMDTYEDLYADYYHESDSDYSEYDYDDYDYDDDFDPFKRSL